MSSTSQDATPKIVAAANAFLATLSDTEKDTMLFDWTDTAQKQRWSNFPTGAFDRAGLMWGDMSKTQQNAWQALMQATLSTAGYNRVLAAWNADDVVGPNLAKLSPGATWPKPNVATASRKVDNRAIHNQHYGA